MSNPSLPQTDPASQSPKLTPFQRIALELASGRDGVWNRHQDNEFRTNVAALQVLRRLEKLGLVEPINAGDTRWTVQFVATDLGRSVLRAADAGSSAAAPKDGGAK